MGQAQRGHEPSREGLLRVGKVKGTRAEEAWKAPCVGSRGGVLGEGVGDLGELAVLGEAQSVGEAGELLGFGGAHRGEMAWTVCQARYTVVCRFIGCYLTGVEDTPSR